MAYFRALADSPEAKSSRWRSTLAGLVALRLIDVWAQGQALPDAGLRALERAIDMMDADSLERPSLKQLGATLSAEAKGRDTRAECLSPIISCIYKYVEALWLTAEWLLCADACRTGIRHAVTRAESVIVPSLYDRLGNCLRASGRPEAALEAFETGRSLASARGDVAAELYLRISEANLEIQLGKTALAERILDEVLIEAERAALPHVCARVHHDRGVIAYRRDDHLAALTCYSCALDAYGTDMRVERVLADMALVILELGHRDVARQAFATLETYSVEQAQRWTATLNLLHIAVLEGDQASFSAHRHKLKHVRLSARLGAYYHLLVGEGWLQFDQPILARRALMRARADARRHGVNEVEARAAESLEYAERAQGERKRPASAAQPTVLRKPSELHPFLTIASNAVSRWQSVRQSELSAA